MRSSLVTAAVIAGGLGLTQATLRPVAQPLWEEMRAAQPALGLATAGAAAGQGLTLGVLGGFRALAADFTWLRVFAIWEDHDLPGTATMLRLVTALDPRPVYFWLNGARMMAYDMTAWRIAAAGGFDAVPEGVRDQLGQEQARLALRRLAEARQFHPASADLWVEQANIELNRLHDPAAAAESYRRAWEQPRAPYYVARLHAEMLRRVGRRAEALAWLVKLHPTLPADEESAGASLVLGRIRDLERELAIAPDQAYRPR